MQKITNMIKQTRVKFLQRPRMRTSTKLVMVFGLFSFISIVCLVIFILSISDHRKAMGGETMPPPVVINGRQEVLEKKLQSDYEVKELDRQSYTMANDTVVLFKKMK
jgi:hypothetical protein